MFSKSPDCVTQIPEPRLSKLFFADTRLAALWFVVRLYVGYEWLVAGWAKVNASAWVGDKAGTALSGFIKGALAKTAGAHPDVQGWYAVFLEKVVLTHPVIWSYVVTYGEVLVGLGLIFGCFAGFAALFGVFMNMNYLLAGTVSVNPILALLGLFIVFAWRIAGWWGVDRWLFPIIGAPWKSNRWFCQIPEK